MRYGQGPQGIIDITRKPSTLKKWAYSLHIFSTLTHDFAAEMDELVEYRDNGHMDYFMYNDTNDNGPILQASQSNPPMCSETGDINTSVLGCSEATTPANNSVMDNEIWTADVIQRVTSLIFIMLLTLVGNTIIIIVLTCSRYRKRNSRVNIFIINLAIGDLTVCFATMTTEILFVAFGEWVLGAAACKILPYLQIVTLASTTFILTTMSFDRYMAICKPLKFSSSTSHARKRICVSWVMAFIFAIPQLFIFVQTVDGTLPDGRIKYGCRSYGYTASWQRKLYFTFMTIYILLVPAVFISYCYINVALVVWRQGREVASSKDNSCTLRKTVPSAIPKAKIKTIKMTFSIIASFIACWTPYFVTTLIRIYSDYKYKIPPSVMVFAETVALLQSALNPLWYGFFNIKLKRGLMEVFCADRLYRKERAKSFNVGGFSECMSVSYDHNCVHAAKRLTVKCRDNNSCSSSGSYERSRTHSCIITEENKNGFRLRVRFMSKETLHVHEHAPYGKPKPTGEECAVCDTMM
ncbi:hypothetical protein ScPMuIL_015247 [Solemya velum]